MNFLYLFILFNYYIRLDKFYISSSEHRNSRLKKSNEMRQYADIYLLLIYSTCFGRPSRPSSGVHKTFGPKTVLIWSCLRKLAPQIVWSVPEAATTVLCTPDDGHNECLKHVESPFLVTFEEACSPHSMICTRGCNYRFMYSWWWARWTPETCRVI